MARKRRLQRAADQTTTTFSCSAKLKGAIEKAAARERRSVSNWIVCQLEDALKGK